MMMIITVVARRHGACLRIRLSIMLIVVDVLGKFGCSYGLCILVNITIILGLGPI
jgi:hypothetical protein